MTSRTALVVVDVQEGIANQKDGVPDADKINKAIGSILRQARQHNDVNSQRAEQIEILFIQHDDKDPEDPLHRGKSTWNLVFPPRQGTENERLVSKDVGNMFESNPDLAASLHAQNVKNFVFVGLQTDFCVRASILGAIASGFDASNITLLQGAHSTYDNASTGRSYLEIKEDVEKQLSDLGVRLRKWEVFTF